MRLRPTSYWIRGTRPRSMNDRGGKYFAVALVVCTLLYGLYQARVLMQGPALVVVEPKNGVRITEPTYSVRGTAHNITRLSINGRTVATDPEGRFTERMVTPRGYGILTVEVENRFGHHDTKHIELVGDPSARTTSTSTTLAV